MEKDIEVPLQGSLEQLDRDTKAIHHAFLILHFEEVGRNVPEINDACKTIIRKQVARIQDLLEQCKVAAAWSLLDERREDFREIKDRLYNQLKSYKDDYEEEEALQQNITQTLLLLNEGADGFRQGFINETYFEELLRKERERYRAENYDHLETLYYQDFHDAEQEHSDETECKNHMVILRRKQFFDTRFGKEYHDRERDERKISAYIVEQRERDYMDIHDFLGAWLAYEIAQEHCREKHEQMYQNRIFKDNVDVDKVMKRLGDFVRDKVLESQKHWFIVFKVFKEKNWLKKTIQTTFRDQMNEAFWSMLRCTQEDFRKVDKYFKNTDYTNWTLADPQAPQCCEDYKSIALKIDQEFQDRKYAKPGTTINTRKIEKFR